MRKRVDQESGVRCRSKLCCTEAAPHSQHYIGSQTELARWHHSAVTVEQLQ